MRLAGWICLFVFTLATAAAEERYKLRAKLIPAVGYATVTISGVNHPYHDQKQIAGKRFRFRGLPKGTYTVVVTHPRWGETRRTIAVTEGTADESGRVEALIAIRRSDEGRSRHLEERSTVSVRELKIPDRAIELRGKAQDALEEQDAEAAADYLQQAVEVAPEYADAWNDLGVLANQRRDFVRAEEYFREALGAAPDDFPPLVNLGGVLLAQRKLAEATRINVQAVKERPGDALANSQLGLCYFHLGEEGLALQYLILAKRLDPGHFTHPQAFLAEIHARNGRYGAAIRELEDLADHYPNTKTGERARAAAEKLQSKR